MRPDIALGAVTSCMAVLGGTVSAYPPVKLWQKIAYTTTFILLGTISIAFVIEQSNLATQADRDLRNALSNLDKSTQQISRMTTLNTELQQKLLEATNTITALSKQGLSTATGGESYASLLFVPQQGFLLFAHRGQYPLYGVSARIVNLDEKNNLMGITVPVGDMIKGHGNALAVPANLAYLTDHVNANIFFTARNGNWTELLRVRKMANGWSSAIRIEGLFTSLKKGKLMCETIDPQFPRSELDKDFAPYNGPTLPSCE